MESARRGWRQAFWEPQTPERKHSHRHGCARWRVDATVQGPWLRGSGRSAAPGWQEGLGTLRSQMREWDFVGVETVRSGKRTAWGLLLCPTVPTYVLSLLLSTLLDHHLL